MNQAVADFLNNIRWFDSGVTLEKIDAQFYLFFGGVLFAFAVCAFGLVVRATKGAGRDIDL